MEYIKTQAKIEATQWHKNGDHPEDGKEMFFSKEDQCEYLCEGKVVRYYRHPDIDGQEKCKHCGVIMHLHGWIESLGSEYIVCPSDWVITEEGHHYPCKSDIFYRTYVPA